MSDDKRDIRREWADRAVVDGVDATFSRAAAGSEPTWSLTPIIATPDGRIAATSLDLISGDAPFGLLPEDDE